MNRILTLSLIIAFLGLNSCATRGTNFPSEFTWIKSNQTTKVEVSSKLGEPYQVGSSSNGSPTWTYGFYKFRLFGKSYTKELKFYWTKSGKVESYSYTSSFPADKRKAISE